LLLFASEIKAIIAHPAVERDVDRWRCITIVFPDDPCPMTMFKGVFKLPAGVYLKISTEGDFNLFILGCGSGQGINPKELTGLNKKERAYYIDGIRHLG